VLFGLIYRGWPSLLLSRLAWPQFALFQIGTAVLVAGKFDIDSRGSGTLAPQGSILIVLGTAVMFWMFAMSATDVPAPQKGSIKCVMPVHKHYGSNEIVARILAAIPWSESDGVALTASLLFPFDQLHGRELFATKEHSARLNPEIGAHLLDIGSGIGGPAGYFASMLGCRVTGIELTPDFVIFANELTSFCGMSDQANFVLADAASIQFKANTFDHAYCLYVGMNLPDKPAVLAECFRVLKPGATLIWTEVTSRSGVPHYPLPWSLTADGSHVDTSDTLCHHLSSAGFEVLTVEDETNAHLVLANRMKLSGKTPLVGQVQANEVVLGPDFVVRRQNYLKSLLEHLIASTLIVARKPQAEHVA
jgi:ubiquinone/menaquinone biosynthesis C-methylase UbiE